MQKQTDVEIAHRNCLLIFKVEFFYLLTVSYVSEFEDHEKDSPGSVYDDRDLI